MQEYKHETFAILSSRQIQHLGFYILIAFVVCFCFSVALKVIESIQGQQRVVVGEAFEKRTKRHVKEDFGKLTFQHEVTKTY